MEDDESTAITLDQLYSAICAGIRSVLPSAVLVDLWPELKRRITLPAVLIELNELEPGEDPYTGETAIIGRFQARIVVDPIMLKSHALCSGMAAALVVALREQRWGLPISPAEFVQAAEDFTKPELDSYRVWMIEWRHEFHMGEIDWPFEDSSGLSFYLGFDPETGPGNEDKYWQLSEAPPDRL